MISPMEVPPATGVEPEPQLMGRSWPPLMGATGEQHTPMIRSSSTERGSARIFDFTPQIVTPFGFKKREM